MGPTRRVSVNGRSPLVRKQSQITTFFSPGPTKRSPALSPNPSPGPNPSSSQRKQKQKRRAPSQTLGDGADESPTPTTRKLRRLRKMALETEKEEDDGGDDGGDLDDDDGGWEKDGEEEDADESEEEDVASTSGKRSGSGRSMSTGVGSAKRKKVDAGRLGCTKKFRFDGDGDGEKGGSPVTPGGKNGSSVGSISKSK